MFSVVSEIIQPPIIDPKVPPNVTIKKINDDMCLPSYENVPYDQDLNHFAHKHRLIANVSVCLTVNQSS